MPFYPETIIPDFLKVTSIVSAFKQNNLTYENINNGEAHSFWEFLYVSNGDINILVDGEVFSLHSGQMIIYPPHSFHSVATSLDAEISVVCFNTSSNAMYDFTSNVLNIDEAQNNTIEQLIEFASTIFESAPRDKYSGGVIPKKNLPDFELQRFSVLLELLLINLYQKNARNFSEANNSNSAKYNDEQLGILTEYLRKNITRNPTLDEISKACSISIPSLHRLCKRQCGCGPITLFISFKISEAKRYISNTSLNFTQISEKLGFSSIHYFSKLFKEKTGMTPSEYSKTVSKK